MRVIVLMVPMLFLWFYLSSQFSVRDSLIECANSEIGVQETTENDGPRIKEYIQSCGFTTSVPWCGCFLTYLFRELSLNYPSLPARAASWTLDNSYKNKYQAVPGDVFTIYYSSKGRVGHTGLIEAIDADYIYTIEGNTNNNTLDGGDYDGDRVMKKLRPWSTIYRTANWVGDYIHTIKPGDNLYRISLKYEVSVEQIKQANKITTSYIKVGQKLYIPGI